jgi:hypothetical protein
MNVSEPFVWRYKAHKFLRDIRIQLLIPREEPGDCPALVK